jgi:large subunit ribosomal protein L4e
MFNPTKIWRRWHRKTNTTQKRHAVASALAATAVPALVMARGHKINECQEIPIVVSDGAQSLKKTKQAIEMLSGLGCDEELEKCADSKKLKCGRGKSRNRRYQMRQGLLVIYNEDDGLTKAVRNIPGVEAANVSRLNLLRIAPGGHFGRMCVWTEGAFRKLAELYGTNRSTAPLKNGYHLPRPIMTNTDVARIINSDEVQSAVRPALEAPKRATQKKNPLKNRNIMARLNPGILHKKLLRANAQKNGTQERTALLEKKRATAADAKKHHKASKEFYRKMMTAYEVKKEDDE